MTPVYLNPPSNSPFQVEEQKDEQHLQLFLSSLRAASSLSCPTYFSSSTDHREQSMIKIHHESQLHDHHKYIAHGGGSSHDLQVFSSSSFQPTADYDTTNNGYKREVGEGSSSTSDNGSSSVKWMPSKMRIMQKMMNSSNSTATEDSVKGTTRSKLQYHHQLQDSTIRVCSDCNTTTTPLWRSGPRGPKSLCNACGIRQRKARRAKEAAAASGAMAVAATSENPGTKIKVQNKEKKSRTSCHVGQYKKQRKPTQESNFHHQIQSQRKLCFKDFAALKQVFSQDVEEAAILLMELSCGFIQS